MQVDAGQVPEVGKGYPADDQHAADAAYEGCGAVYLLGNTAQEEQA